MQKRADLSFFLLYLYRKDQKTTKRHGEIVQGSFLFSSVLEKNRKKKKRDRRISYTWENAFYKMTHLYQKKKKKRNGEIYPPLCGKMRSTKLPSYMWEEKEKRITQLYVRKMRSTADQKCPPIPGKKKEEQTAHLYLRNSTNRNASPIPESKKKRKRRICSPIAGAPHLYLRKSTKEHSHLYLRKTGEDLSVFSHLYLGCISYTWEIIQEYMLTYT